MTIQNNIVNNKIALLDIIKKKLSRLIIDP